MIVPKAYLGWHSQLGQGGHTSAGSKENLPNLYRGDVWVECDLAHLEAHYRRRSTREVVTGLSAMYYGGEPRSVCLFGDILAQMIEFQAEWVRVGGGN